MKRSTVMMIIGISMQIINWVFSSISSHLFGLTAESVQSIKGILGIASIVGWLVFFAGIGIRQLDKRKSLNSSKRGKKSQN